MQSTASLEIKVGLLLISGLIAVVILILVSDRVDFESRYRVTGYLPDAEGLLVGSPVTLSGIRIGKVVSIEPDHSGRSPIRVGMDIIYSYDIPSTSTLTLATSGILGDAYLSFSGPGDDPGPPLAKDGSASFDGSPGFFAEVSEQARAAMSAVNDLLDAEARAQVRRLLVSSADTMEQGSTLLSGLNQRQERLDGILDRFDELLAAGNRVGAGVERTVDQAQALLTEASTSMTTLRPALQSTLEGAEATMARVASMAERMDGLLADDGAGVPVLLSDASRSLSSLARIMEELEQGRGILGQLLRSHSLARDLNTIAIDLSKAAEVIADRPSVLVWGQGGEETEASRQLRQTLRERRSFMEGYGPRSERERADEDTVP